MKTHANKDHENKNQAASVPAAQESIESESTFQFEDKRPYAISLRNFHEIANNSPQVKQLRAIQEMADNHSATNRSRELAATNDGPVQKKEASDSKEPIQGMFGDVVQRFYVECGPDDTGPHGGHFKDTVTGEIVYYKWIDGTRNEVRYTESDKNMGWAFRHLYRDTIPAKKGKKASPPSKTPKKHSPSSAKSNHTPKKVDPPSGKPKTPSETVDSTPKKVDPPSEKPKTASETVGSSPKKVDPPSEESTTPPETVSSAPAKKKASPKKASSKPKKFRTPKKSKTPKKPVIEEDEVEDPVAPEFTAASELEIKMGPEIERLVEMIKGYEDDYTNGKYITNDFSKSENITAARKAVETLWAKFNDFALIVADIEAQKNIIDNAIEAEDEVMGSTLGDEDYRIFGEAQGEYEKLFPKAKSEEFKLDELITEFQGDVELKVDKIKSSKAASAEMIRLRGLWGSAKLAKGHFIKHKGDTGYNTEEKYLEEAEKLTNSIAGGTISSKIRGDGDRLFFNSANGDFAIKSTAGKIRTLFRPPDGINYYNRQR